MVRFYKGEPSVGKRIPVVSGMVCNRAEPFWNWTSGGFGIGTFRYKLDSSDLTVGSTETTELTYSPTSILADGSHTLYVQEKIMLANGRHQGSSPFSLIPRLPKQL
jgi:hypothetical protein